MDATHDEQPQEDRDMALIKAHAVQIMEHFDTVQIFVTRYTADGTIAADTGRGNWYAREGQVAEWLVKSKERERINVRNEDDDD